MARTSRDWWRETKASPERLLAWLEKQHHGEATAAERIERYCAARLPAGDPRRRVLAKIAAQERRHATWVAGLLRARGAEPRLLREKPERYWRRVVDAIHSFEEAAGVAHHAEVMRLERIRTVAADPFAAEDIRDVFQRILREEEFHARAFAALAGAAAIARTRAAHDEGAAAIGFVTEAEAA